MKTLALLPIALLCAGCFHIHHGDGSGQNMSSVNQLAHNQVLYVHHFGNRKAVAKNLKISPSHTSWMDATTGSYVTIPTREIVNIKILEAQSQRGNGFGMGMLAGASMGVMLGVSGDASPSEKSTIAVLGGLGFGLLGGMVAQMTNVGGGAKYRIVWTNPEVPIRRAVW